MLRRTKLTAHPNPPQNFRITKVTDTAITYAWDEVDGANYYLLYMSNRTAPRAVFSNEITIEGLSFSTVYTARVSAFRRGQEGAQSEELSQKTLLPAPTISRFLYGESYVNGTSVNLPSVTNCKLYRKGESTALLTGTITSGVLRIYVLNNVNIVAGAQYDIRAIDGNPNQATSVPGMATTITAELAKLELNAVTSSARIVSGKTEPNGFVRLTVDNVARTVPQADADGNFSITSSAINANSLIKVETKVGSIYPTHAALRADSGLNSIPTAPIRNLMSIESFTTLNAWTLQSGAGTSRVIDTVNTKDTQAIKLTADKTIAFMRNTTTSIAMEEATALECLLFVHDVTTLDKVIVYLANDTGLANNVSFTINSYELTSGWNTVAVALSSGKVTGAFTTAQAVKAMQVRVEPKTEMKAEVSFDLISSVKADKANVLFVFDDAWDEAALGITALESKSLRANISVVEVNESDARFMTNAELKALNLKGHDLLNHTKEHPHLDTLSKADQRVQFDSCKTYLTTNNWTRANDIVIYPYGDYNADTLSALAEGSYKLGRPLTSGIEITSPNNNYLVRTYNLTPDRTIAQAKNTIDYAIATGGTLLFLNHRLGTTEQMADTMFWRATGLSN
ncbi:polysaccharide deacetylase family protein [Listeria rocourtiae]|uniref:polysaccharide deacetylase family protein n=1 Tax=Listeria rocourtiae TaxID=647910 RepID=UPI0011EA546B|nr:polysaccharide deacetylase family protein [Listeria rocourtiae]